MSSLAVGAGGIKAIENAADAHYDAARRESHNQAMGSRAQFRADYRRQFGRLPGVDPNLEPDSDEYRDQMLAALQGEQNLDTSTDVTSLLGDTARNFAEIGAEMGMTKLLGGAKLGGSVLKLPKKIIRDAANKTKGVVRKGRDYFRVTPARPGRYLEQIPKVGDPSKITAFPEFVPGTAKILTKFGTSTDDITPALLEMLPGAARLGLGRFLGGASVPDVVGHGVDQFPWSDDVMDGTLNRISEGESFAAALYGANKSNPLPDLETIDPNERIQITGQSAPGLDEVPPEYVPPPSAVNQYEEQISDSLYKYGANQADVKELLRLMLEQNAQPEQPRLTPSVTPTH